jgi:excisionase family DNA binding protein
VNTLGELLTIDQAAQLLNVTPKAARLMVDRGAMPGVVRIGRRVRVRRDELRKSVGLPL